MYLALVLLGAMLFPVAALALLLLLAHLEETLPRDVGQARRQPPPPPILAIEVCSDRRPAVTPRPLIPAQRGTPSESVPDPVGQPVIQPVIQPVVAPHLRTTG